MPVACVSLSAERKERRGEGEKKRKKEGGGRERKERRGEGEKKESEIWESKYGERPREIERGGDSKKEKGGRKGQWHKVVNTRFQCIYSWLHMQYGCVCLLPNFLLSPIQSWLDLVIQWAKPKCFC